jgi:hypothetical protein
METPPSQSSDGDEFKEEGQAFVDSMQSLGHKQITFGQSAETSHVYHTE